jgi:hypothetical protein
MSTTVVAQSDYSITQYIEMKTYGDTVVLSIRGDGTKNLTFDDPGGRRKPIEVAAYDSEDVIPIPFETQNSNINWGGQNVSMSFPGIRSLNPTVLLIALIVNLRNTGDPGSAGPTPVLVAGPFGFADSGKIFEFGESGADKNPIAVMRRLVVISDMTYVAEISFWRE